MSNAALMCEIMRAAAAAGRQELPAPVKSHSMDFGFMLDFVYFLFTKYKFEVVYVIIIYSSVTEQDQVEVCT